MANEIASDAICASCGHAARRHWWTMGEGSLYPCGECACLNFAAVPLKPEPEPQPTWTPENLQRLFDWVLKIDCGYCLDGADVGDNVCPECGAVALIAPDWP